MKFNFMDTLFTLSYALDCVEHDLIGVTNWHGKRVAYVSARMGQALGLDTEHLMDLCTLAVLHDCALSEYVQEEYQGSFIDASADEKTNFERHCTMGEQMMQFVPFFDRNQAKEAILYHHENADGSGSFHKKTEKTPLYARLIHLADTLDTAFDLSIVTPEKLDEIGIYLFKYTDILFDADMVSCFQNLFDLTQLSLLRDEKVNLALSELLPDSWRELTPGQLIDFAGIFASIVDYKSRFTKTHSIGIAEKTKKMAAFYGADEELSAKLFFAGALHDIGKLTVDRDVLEKPGRLSDLEYKHVQKHAYQTYAMLSQIEGMEDITKWAAYHHEKLDGSGYPFRLTSEQLDHWSRLIACLDIYQALTEERPYKSGMPHEKACGILQNLAANGKLDASIVQDISLQLQ